MWTNGFGSEAAIRSPFLSKAAEPVILFFDESTPLLVIAQRMGKPQMSWPGLIDVTERNGLAFCKRSRSQRCCCSCTNRLDTLDAALMGRDALKNMFYYRNLLHVMLLRISLRLKSC
jgi:hypothetical protein